MRNWYSSCYLALSSCCWFSFFSQKKKLWGIDSCCFIICNTHTHLHAHTLEIKVAFMYAGWMKSFVFSLLNFCVYVCIWGMCAHGVQKLMSSVFLNFSPIYHYFWDIISFWTRNSTFWIGWLTSKPRDCTDFTLLTPCPALVLQALAAGLRSCVHVGGPDSSPPACAVDTLPVESLPQPLNGGGFFFPHVGCLSCLWCSF